MTADLTAELYEELRRLAHRYLADERSDISLSATDLVHEAYFKLCGTKLSPTSRSDFMRQAAVAMRRLLIDRARRRSALKRQHVVETRTVQTIAAPGEPDALDLLALDEALTQLRTWSPRHADIVQLRFFCGLTISETAEILEVSPSTIDNDWAYAKAWLTVQIQGRGDSAKS